MRTEPELEAADALAAGHEALSRGEWEQALTYFEAASEQRQSAEAIEALAMAALVAGQRAARDRVARGAVTRLRRRGHALT
jgi:uncharacterized protein HemY